MDKKIEISFKISIISVLSSLFISCKKEISLDLRTVEPILVVQAEIAEGSTASVKLTQTLGYYQPNVFTPITDATVTLTNDSGELEEMTLFGDSIFKTRNIKGTANTTYYLSIIYKGKTYTSVSTLYPPVLLDSVVPKFIHPDFPPYFQAYWQDPKSKDIDFYRFRVFINDSTEIKQNFIYSADIYDGEYFMMPIMIDQKNLNDEPTFLPDDRIRFDMQTLNRAMGEFFTFLNTYSETNPPSNITGGALGYFSAYSVSSKSTIVPYSPYWERRD
jgi:hypothetical protein